MSAVELAATATFTQLLCF